jgi:hypothetical protein
MNAASAEKKKREYINRDVYHSEIVACKKSGELTPKAIEMFTRHVKEVSKAFYFEFSEDREDAVQSAIHDFLKYWKGIRENNVVQMKLLRDFVEGEELTIHIDGCKPIRCVAGKRNDFKNGVFKVDDTVNHTLENLASMLEKHRAVVEITLHKVTKKITFMDNKNGDDLSVRSHIQLKLKSKSKLSKTIKTDSSDKVFFENPPNIFNTLTSYARNGIIKHINKHNPKIIRNGNMIRFSQINPENNGFYNL